MVIWLSGAYGVGKSAVARAVCDRLPNTLVFDAEEVGNAVRNSYPDCPYGYIFEDYPLWTDFCRQLIQDVHDRFRKNILVDMTLVRENSRIQILDRLKADGLDVRFFVLTASRQTIHDRILARGEDEECWCMENLDMAMERSAAIPGSILVNTDDVPVDAVANQVLSLCELQGEKENVLVGCEF